MLPPSHPSASSRHTRVPQHSHPSATAFTPECHTASTRMLQRHNPNGKAFSGEQNYKTPCLSMFQKVDTSQNIRTTKVRTPIERKARRVPSFFVIGPVDKTTCVKQKRKGYCKKTGIYLAVNKFLSSYECEPSGWHSCNWLPLAASGNTLPVRMAKFV